MPKPSSSKPAPALDRATEDRILLAARTVFLRRGTAGARMREIAEEAGVNQALLHYYFRSKDRLAEAVFTQVARRLFPPLIAALGSDEPLEAKVERVVALYFDLLGANPFMPGYLIGEITQNPARARQLVEAGAGARPEEVAPQVLGRLAAQIRERIDAGTLRPITPDQFVINLVSLCIFPFAARPMVMAMMGFDDASFAAMIERRRETLPDFFMRGMRP